MNGGTPYRLAWALATQSYSRALDWSSLWGSLVPRPQPNREGLVTLLRSLGIHLHTQVKCLFFLES